MNHGPWTFELGKWCPGAGEIIPPNATLIFEVELLGVSEPLTLGQMKSDEFVEAQAQGAVIVDIRREDEWQKTGVIDGAKTITAFTKAGRLHQDFLQKFSSLVPSLKTPIVLYCRTGNRTTKLGNALVSQPLYFTRHVLIRRIGCTMDIPMGDNALKKEVINILGATTIRSLRAISPLHTIYDGLLILSSGLFSFYIIMQYGGLSNLSEVSVIILMIIFNGVIVNWINVQIHEASHILLFKNKKLNDIYADIALGCWALHDVSTYRSTHFLHHSHLHSEKDPDKKIYEGHKRTSLSRCLLEDLCGLTALKRIIQVKGLKNQDDTRRSVAPVVFKVLAQFFLLSLCVQNFYGHGFFIYFLGVLVPIFCVFPALVRIRTIIQHSHEEREIRTFNFCSRTTVTNLIERIFIGARMDYHFEHHLFPSIPHYNLKKMHDMLVKHGFFEKEENRNFRTLTYVFQKI